MDFESGVQALFHFFIVIIQLDKKKTLATQQIHGLNVTNMTSGLAADFMRGKNWRQTGAKSPIPGLDMVSMLPLRSVKEGVMGSQGLTQDWVIAQFPLRGAHAGNGGQPTKQGEDAIGVVPTGFRRDLAGIIGTVAHVNAVCHGNALIQLGVGGIAAQAGGQILDPRACFHRGETFLVQQFGRGLAVGAGGGDDQIRALLARQGVELRGIVRVFLGGQGHEARAQGLDLRLATRTARRHQDPMSLVRCSLRGHAARLTGTENEYAQGVWAAMAVIARIPCWRYATSPAKRLILAIASIAWVVASRGGNSQENVVKSFSR